VFACFSLNRRLEDPFSKYRILGSMSRLDERRNTPKGSHIRVRDSGLEQVQRKERKSRSDSWDRAFPGDSGERANHEQEKTRYRSDDAGEFRTHGITPGSDARSGISPDVTENALEVSTENLFDDRRRLPAAREFFRDHFHVRRATQVGHPGIAVFTRRADMQLLAPRDVSIEQPSVPE
jgi:hypothetical protein